MTSSYRFRHRSFSTFAAVTVLVVAAAAALAIQIDDDAFIPVRTAEQYASDAAVAPIVSVDNAALLYYRYFELLDDELADSVKAFAADNGGWDNHDWIPNEELAEQLAAADSIRGFLRATTIDNADFGVEVELGVFAILSHLTPMRATARLVAADARRLAAEGDIDAAARRIAALHTAARHTSQDSVVISSLVGMAIAKLACGETQHLAESGQLSTESRDLLLDAINAYDNNDPFSARQSITNERDIFLAWIRVTFADATGQELLDAFATIAGPQGHSGLAELTAEQLAADMDRTLDYYDTALRVWPNPDAVAQLHDLEKVVQAGGFGATAVVIAPSLEKVRENQTRAQEMIVKTRNALNVAKIKNIRTLESSSAP